MPHLISCTGPKALTGEERLAGHRLKVSVKLVKIQGRLKTGQTILKYFIHFGNCRFTFFLSDRNSRFIFFQRVYGPFTALA